MSRNSTLPSSNIICNIVDAVTYNHNAQLIQIKQTSLYLTVCFLEYLSKCLIIPKYLEKNIFKEKIKIEYHHKELIKILKKEKVKQK